MHSSTSRRQAAGPHYRVHVNPRTREGINLLRGALAEEWWQGWASFINEETTVDLSFETDASTFALGVFYEGMGLSVRLTEKYTSGRINWLEARAVRVALEQLGHLWRGKVVRVFCDNSATVALINRMKSTSAVQRDIGWELARPQMRHGFQLIAEHRAGIINDRPDARCRAWTRHATWNT